MSLCMFSIVNMAFLKGGVTFQFFKVELIDVFYMITQASRYNPADLYKKMDIN